MLLNLVVNKRFCCKKWKMLFIDAINMIFWIYYVIIESRDFFIKTIEFLDFLSLDLGFLKNSMWQPWLPKISLPRFNGDVTKFQHFWQSFRCAIDENQCLSNVHKLNYLVNSLEGQVIRRWKDLKYARKIIRRPLNC